MRKCSKCKEIKDEACFSKDRKSKDGLDCRCRDCAKEYKRLHEEEIKEQRKEHYKLHKKGIKEYQKEYRRSHKEEIKEQKKEYYKLHKEGIKERVKEYGKGYYATPQGKAVRSNSNAKRRATIGDQEISKEGWLEVMRSNNWKCIYCGETLTEKTRSIDHLVPLNLGGKHIKDNLVPSCRVCNSSKQDKLLTNWLGFETLKETSPDVANHLLDRLIANIDYDYFEIVQKGDL